MRRVLRWTVRLLLAALALAVVATIAFVIVLHTAWGREQVRRRIEAALAERIRGDVRVGGVEGSPLGELVLVDVEIDDDAGQPVARIDRASLNVGLWSLLSHELELEYLRVDGAVVHGTQEPDGTLDLARLIVLDEESMAWDVTIDELALTGVAFELDHQGVVEHVDDVELHGIVAVRDGGQRVTASTTLTAWWRERTLPITAAGGVRVDGAVISLAGVKVDAGGVVVVSPAIALDGTTITGVVSAFVPAATVARLVPESPLRGDVTMTIGVAAGVLSVAGIAGGAPVFGTGTGDVETRRVRGHLRAIGVDPGRHDVVLDADLDLSRSRGELRAIVTGPRGDWLTANLAVELVDLEWLSARGRIHGHALAVADARARDVTIDVDVTGLPSAIRGAVHVAARGVTRGRDVIGPMTIDATTRDDGRIDVVASLGTRRSEVQLAGTATVTLGDTVRIALGHYAGRLGGATVAGRGGVIAVWPARVSIDDLRLRVARGRIAVDGWYGRASGDLRADVMARGVELAAVARILDQPPGPRGRADLTAHVARAGLAWSGEVHGRGRGLVLRAGGAPIDGAVDASARGRVVRVAASVRGMRLGQIAVALDVAPPHDLFDPRAWRRLSRRAIRDGRVTLDAVDLVALASAAGVASDLRGRLDGALALSAGRVDATLDATVEDLGVAHVTATISIPARPFEIDAWRHLEARDVHGVDATIDDVPLDGELARRLGLGTAWQGRASVAVSVAAGLRDATITADVLGVRGGPLLRRVDLHVDARADRKGVTAQVKAGIGGAWTLDAAGTLAVSPAAVLAHGFAAVRAAPLTATLTVAEMSVRRLLQTIGRDQALDGTVRVDAQLRGTLAAPEGEATFTLADVGAMSELRVDARLAAGAVKVKARGRQDDGGTLQVDASTPLANLDEVRARIVARAFELAPLAALGPIETLGVAGKLDADLAIRGVDPATARIEGTLHLRDARLPISASVGSLRRGDLTAAIRGHRLDATASGRIGAGKVALTASARLVGLVPHRVDVTLDVHGVTLLAPRSPKVDAHVAAKIVRRADQWRVSAEVRDTRVVLSADPGRVLHDVGAPDDIVFVDDGKRPPAEAMAKVQQRRFGMRPAHPWLVGEIKLRRTTIKADELRGQIRGNLTLEVGDDAVAVLGAVDALQGDVVLFDRRYRIDHAQVRFDGSDDPHIDVRLIDAFPQLTLVVNMRGRLSDPSLELGSDPADYSQGQLLGFFFGATPGGRPGDETRDAATSIASSLASARLGGIVRRYLPVKVDVLRFEAATAHDRASITVGEWLSRRLFVGYRRRIDSIPEQNAGQAEVEYWLSPRIVVEGVAGDRGYHDLDLTWVRRW